MWIWVWKGENDIWKARKGFLPYVFFSTPCFGLLIQCLCCYRLFLYFFSCYLFSIVVYGAFFDDRKQIKESIKWRRYGEESFSVKKLKASDLISSIHSTKINHQGIQPRSTSRHANKINFISFKTRAVVATQAFQIMFTSVKPRWMSAAMFSSIQPSLSCISFSSIKVSIPDCFFRESGRWRSSANYFKHSSWVGRIQLFTSWKSNKFPFSVSFITSFASWLWWGVAICCQFGLHSHSQHSLTFSRGLGVSIVLILPINI